MQLHTTFRIGGKADLFVTPVTIDALSQIVRVLIREKAPFFLLGNGSNLLVSDEGYRGVIVCTRKLAEIKAEGESILASSGTALKQIALFAEKEGFSGFEFAYGIPGTLGGALFMNAGAYGGEMSQVISEVTLLDHEGSIRTIKGDKMNWGYRSSILRQKNWMALSARVQLHRGDRSAIRALMEKYQKARIEKQPLEYPSAGSTFKRPKGYFAGKLIMDSGLAGYQIGGAAISEKHCGFVINKEQATCEDVRRLIRKVQETVEAKFHVHLEPEVRFLA